jgi:ribosomal protein S18 acetylase RimI-like enzyme
LRSARLYSLIVVPASRKRGTATELVERIEAAARRRGYERLSLEVRIGNRAALGLYEKLMYRIVRRLPRFYDDGSDAWRLERALVSGGARADSPSLTV